MFRAGLSFLAVIAVAAIGQPVWAQQGAAPIMKTFASSSDIQAMIAKAKSERKENQPLVTQPILRLAPYAANLEYRASVGPAAVHEKEAEMFYVIDGSATLVTGGKLVNESRTNAENLTGTAIEGGNPRAVAKGDFIVVPENTPHWFSPINGAIILMSLHVPRSAGAAH
ncbi:MAG: cupin domain-containing protein [Acidobacteriia bacterium]|nr:cupin domain-containing protein [Terriglobia bacterium]MBV9744003.1 cupin domain-containing protein [Terriglobia bacterium]